MPGPVFKSFYLWVLLVLMWPGPLQAEGDAAKGKEISELHCARCHVVSEETRYAGINSTPSFFILVKMEDYYDRFATFFDRRPHPAFVEMEGVEPWTDLPSPIAPFSITIAELDDILRYVETLRSE